MQRYAYIQESMNKALAEVKENGLSIEEAARVNEIHRKILMYHLKNYKDGKVEISVILTEAEETIIVHALKKL